MSQTDMTVSVDISVGELLDKITILQIKAERIDDAAKQKNVAAELAMLEAKWNQAELDRSRFAPLIADLKTVNSELWEIEDRIREHERRRDFGPSFIELARAVYRTNDRRSEVKRQINEESGSRYVEEKSYSPYDEPA